MIFSKMEENSEKIQIDSKNQRINNVPEVLNVHINEIYNKLTTIK